MSTENNKRVRINEDGILSIINDNATWVNGDVTTDISGDYTISANDLKRLMAMVTGHDMVIHDIDTRWYVCDWEPATVSSTVMTTNKALAEEIESMHKAYDNRVKSENKATRDYKELLKKIENFNKSRRWWERKITI